MELRAFYVVAVAVGIIWQWQAKSIDRKKNREEQTRGELIIVRGYLWEVYINNIWIGKLCTHHDEKA